jgi:hypothetical protein
VKKRGGKLVRKEKIIVEVEWVKIRRGRRIRERGMKDGKYG